ncbi:MAG TPA: ABC transporter ATP-binding protein [Steroidobacteraceae bacterium]|nr:ABC transporter ATP-binding protein [Steroidobacteraceae bacterium]
MSVSTQGSPRDAYVRIEHLSKRFGDFPAVDDVSLEIHRGEIFCLLGGSGSGKTTLLRLLAGFESPGAGRIYLDGEDMSAIPPHRRPVNMMFQSYALFPHMSVEKNVAFGLEQERLGREEIKRRVGEILEIVRMTPYALRKPHQLSGGQRQRVALARALVKRPKLLLLDEPLAALDRKLREHTQFELLAIHARLGVTFVVVTHDQQEAMTLASRMGVMNRGRIVQVGTPAEIYEAPATRFVADFIGSVNLFEGRALESQDGCHTIECAELGGAIRVVRPHAEAGAVTPSHGALVWVAVRPERIDIEPHAAADAPADGRTRLEGVVKEVGYMGEMSVYLVAIGSGRTLRVTRPNVAQPGARRIMREDRVRLSWRATSPVVLRE